MQYWCCAASGGADTAVFWYTLPPPFAKGFWGPWQAPVLERPTYCDDPNLSPAEKESISFANHPCQFMSNATAAAISAAIVD